MDCKQYHQGTCSIRFIYDIFPGINWCWKNAEIDIFSNLAQYIYIILIYQYNVATPQTHITLMASQTTIKSSFNQFTKFIWSDLPLDFSIHYIKTVYIFNRSPLFVEICIVVFHKKKLLKCRYFVIHSLWYW